MNDELANLNYLSGEELTVADIVIGFDLSMIDKNKQLADFNKDYPNIANYLQKIQARESYQKAVKKSGELG